MTLAPEPRFALAEEDVLGERMLVFRERRRSLADLLEASREYAERDYLVDGERRLSYAEHHRAAVAIATELRDRYGVQPGSRVAILGSNRLEWVAVFWATVVLGAIAVGLNAWWSAAELADALDDADPLLVVVDRARLERLGATPRRVAVMEDFAPLLGGAEGELPAVSVAEDDPAVILYTSGTTGRSKGAVHSHRCLIGLVQIQQLIAAGRPSLPGAALAPRILSTVPLFHVSGLHSGVVAALGTGATVVWQSGRFDPEAVLSTIARERCTQWTAVPTSVWRVVHHVGVDRHDLSSLRHIGGGGAAWSPALQARMRSVFGPQLTWGVGYGLTECTGLATAASPAELAADPTTVGRPVPTVQLEVRGADDQPLPDGAEGEICLRSPLLMLGYWRNPAATAAVLGPHRWLHTGDIGRLSGGGLCLSARRVDLIIRGGENVYPAEIESCLEDHPAVVECAVLGSPSDEFGQEVVGVVRLLPGTTCSCDDLAKWVGERLAYFKVPGRWQIVTDPLPRTSTGKVIRAVLFRRLARLEDGGGDP